MRSRKEIMDDKGVIAINTKLFLEVLLDIREFLEDIKNRR